MPTKRVLKNKPRIKEDDPFVGADDDKKLIIQMHKPMWEKLRRLAFDMNISMAELCRQGIEIILEKYSNKK